MPIKTMLFADAEGNWWDYMSPEAQKKYISDHPNSMHAKEHLKKEEEKKKKKVSGPKKEENPKSDTKDTEEKKTPANPSEPGSPALVRKESFAVRLKSMLAKKQVHPEDHKMFEDGGEQRGSKQRVKIAGTVKKSTSRIIDHLKTQGKEWKHGVSAIKKLASGGTLTDHDKEALKAISKDILITVGSVAVTGGLGHGMALALGHVGYDLVKDSILKSLAHGVVGAKVNSRIPVIALSSDEKLMEKIIHELADFIANGDIPDEAWEKAVSDLSKKKSRQDNVHNKDKDKKK